MTLLWSDSVASHPVRMPGTMLSEHVVKVQIWTSISVYVLVTIVKKRLNFKASLYTLLQIFSVPLVEKISLNQDFLDGNTRSVDEQSHNQLNLFDF